MKLVILCLQSDPKQRPGINQIMEDPWLTHPPPPFEMYQKTMEAAAEIDDLSSQVISHGRAVMREKIAAFPQFRSLLLKSLDQIMEKL